MIKETTIEEFFDGIFEKIIPKSLNDEKYLILLSTIRNGKLTILKNWKFEMIENRLKHHDIELDESSIHLLSIFCHKPSDITIYLWYIQYCCHRQGIYELDYKEMLELIFFDGFFSDEQLNEIWQIQKTEKNNNLLDNYNAGKSLLIQTPRPIR